MAEGSEWGGFPGVGLECRPIKIQLDFASQANVSYETAQLFADIQRVLHRSGADVDIDGALLDGFGDLQ